MPSALNGAYDNGAAGGSGDVVGPGSATDNALARFDTTTGKLIQNSNATLSDNGALALTGTADAVQLTVKGHSTQTSDIFNVTDSSNVSLLTVDNDGVLTPTFKGVADSLVIGDVDASAMTQTDALIIAAGTVTTTANHLRSVYVINGDQTIPFTANDAVKIGYLGNVKGSGVAIGATTTAGSASVTIGSAADCGNNSTTVGQNAGNASADNSINLGQNSGLGSTRDHTLYIDNANDTSTPFIYGEIDTELLKFNAALEVIDNNDALALKVTRSGSTVTNPIAEFYSDVTSADTVHAKIMCDGDLENTNNSYGAISDLKLKDNVVPATDKLLDLLRVNIVHFNFKDNPGFKQIGVIAQELEEVFPGLVKTTPDMETIPDPDWVPKLKEKEKTRIVQKEEKYGEVELIDGKHVFVNKTKTIDVVEPVGEFVQLYNEDGTPMVREMKSEKGKVIKTINLQHFIPETEMVPEDESNRPFITRQRLDENGNPSFTKSVKYSVFVPMLIKAIQELNAKVDA